MSEFNDPAYPCWLTERDDHGNEVARDKYGMTIRQAFVMAALQGLMSSIPHGEVWSHKELAAITVQVADACLWAERETR